MNTLTSYYEEEGDVDEYDYIIREDTSDETLTPVPCDIQPQRYLSGMSDCEGDRASIPVAENVVNSLRKHFSCIKKTAFKRCQNGSSFSHCGEGVSLGKRYSELRQLMERHAVLQLKKDSLTRIHQFEIFIRNLKKLVQEETSSWQAINHSRDAELEDHQTNLTALSSICDEFRMHLNHWMCIKQRIQNNRWLRPLLPSMLEEMRYLNSYFVRLQESAVWWTEKLLRCGMQVFAYVDRRSLTYNDVFSIVRGIEEYNTLIQLVRVHTHEMMSSYQPTSIGNNSNGHRLIQPPMGGMDSSTMKSVHFIRLLHSLAFEWAKSAVAITRHFVDNHSELVTMMRQQCCRKVMDEPIMTQDLGCGNRSPTPSTQQHTTSDYFSDSLNRHSGRQLVTDLTTHASPLVDFGRKEREYIGKVVQITCQRTTLLRKNRPSTLHTNDQQRVPNEGNASIIQEESAFSRRDNKRKSVSWGDSHDIGVCRQLTTKYDDALWKSYAARLEDSLCYEINWSRPGGHKGSIGCVDLCSPAALQVFTSSLEVAAKKGFFTGHASQQILQVICTLSTRSALSLCDAAISRCLISIQTDKAMPIPLHEGRKSTRTAVLLRKAIMFTMPKLTHQKSLKKEYQGSPTHQHFMEYKIKNDILLRLGLLTDLSLKWCLGKATEFLASYRVSSFVLITHGDLLILQKDLSNVIGLVHTNLFSTKVQQIQSKLAQMSQFYDKMEHQLSEKAASLAAEIISQRMPPNKLWRRNVAGEELSVQDYAESLIDSVLMPVADGAKNLCPEDQLSAMETVLESICNSWKKYFLQRKVKFSVMGAKQLRADLGYLYDFIDVYVTEESVKARLYSSACLSTFSAIIDCLSEQREETPTQRVTSKNSVAPMETIRPSADFEGKQQWVALRMNGSGKRHLIPCYCG